MGENARPRTLTAALTPPQLHAARCVIARVRAEIGADLVQASLFGSRARGDARPDSDIDLLLVFRHLPPDREPFATEAEQIAEEEAVRLRIPVSVWSVSLVDFACGNRTPMLVDAVADWIPIWFSGRPLPPIGFTRADAIGCVRALLRRTEEGSAEFRQHLKRGDVGSASRRLRDDLVRVCTATLLLDGLTRPRRGGVMRAYIDREEPPSRTRAVLEWAERSFGIRGTDEESAVPPPPGGLELGARVVERVRAEAGARHFALRSQVERASESARSGRSGEWSLRSTARVRPR